MQWPPVVTALLGWSPKGLRVLLKFRQYRVVVALWDQRGLQSALSVLTSSTLLFSENPRDAQCPGLPSCGCLLDLLHWPENVNS